MERGWLSRTDQLNFRLFVPLYRRLTNRLLFPRG